MSSEFVFRVAFGSLDVVDFVVVDLFGVNGISEFSEDIEDGIKGGLGLEL